MLGANGVERVAGDEVDAAACDGGASHDGLGRLLVHQALVAQRQLDVTQDLAAVGVRAQDIELAALGSDVDFAVGKYGRGLLNHSQVLLPQLPAGLHIEREEVAAVIHLV